MFFKQLDEELLHAKERSYENVVDILLQMRDILEPEKFLLTVRDIKTNYRRRSNLMGKLAAQGW